MFLILYPPKQKEEKGKTVEEMRALSLKIFYCFETIKALFLCFVENKFKFTVTPTYGKASKQNYYN